LAQHGFKGGDPSPSPKPGANRPLRGYLTDAICDATRDAIIYSINDPDAIMSPRTGMFFILVCVRNYIILTFSNPPTGYFFDSDSDSDSDSDIRLFYASTNLKSTKYWHLTGTCTVSVTLSTVVNVHHIYMNLFVGSDASLYFTTPFTMFGITISC